MSLSSWETGGEPVEQLDRAVELIHRVTRGLPESALTRDELIALAGLLVQLGSALLTFTDQLLAPVQHCDRTRSATPAETTTETPTDEQAEALLRECRRSFLAATTSARELHARIRR
ncbi:MAG TPA: hypothetical protein VHH34_25065 [Pseudonocardiaceae bacterium]|nr:hypothetical protein [Pseudonocardiaceae bacterium]